MKPGWLLLLFICARVWSVPIDRNGGDQEAKEEVQEENRVTRQYSLLFFPNIIFWIRWLIGPFHPCRTQACTTTGISER